MPTINPPRRSTISLGQYGSAPAYERVSSIPSWLPTQQANERELTEQYRGTNDAYSTSAFDQASEAQQSRVLTTALNAGNNAAAEYANRARQSGGSGLGAGLVKAEAATGARATAGAMELDRQRFDASQREAAATHATQIATTLGQLRQSYLGSLVQYATSEDATMAGYMSNMAQIAANDPNRRRTGGLAYNYGTGLGRGSTEFSFGSADEATNYFQNNRGRQTAYGFVPPNYGGG